MRLAAAAGLSLCVLAASASAHHSFGAIYDQGREVAFEAVVREFRFIHPHPVLVVEATAGQPATGAWRAEMDNRYELEDIGISVRTFRPGDVVRVSGSPGRNEANILYLWKLDRPSDGLRYEQVGTTPKVTFRK